MPVHSYESMYSVFKSKDYDQTAQLHLCAPFSHVMAQSTNIILSLSTNSFDI